MIFSMRRGRPWLAMMGIGALVACGGGGSAGQVGGTTCAAGQTLQADDYMVENNSWNKGTVSGFRQCVDIAAAEPGTVAVNFDWSWPQAQGAGPAYPEVIYGQKPWYPSTTPRLPRMLSQVKAVRADLAFGSTHPDGSGNLAFDIWLTTANTRPNGSDHLPIAHELMIWLDAWGGMVPGGTPVDTVSLGGITWDLHLSTITSGTDHWQYIAYSARTPVASPAQLDLRLFLDHLKARGSITGNEWLASVELGNEIVAGTGRTQLTRFKVTVE